MFVANLRQRLAREEGFTLIELLVVIVIIGILLAIAIPSYLGFKGQAADSAAKANIREAVPSAEAYFADKGTYVGMHIAVPGGTADPANLKETYDTGMKVQDAGVTNHGVVLGATAPTATAYCIQAQGRDAAHTFHFSGPGGEVLPGTC